MVLICAWCQKYMGSMEPFHEPYVSHGICNGCFDREALDDAPVLVVSRNRSRAIAMLRALLRGAPEIEVVVDRRGRERRGERAGEEGDGRPIAYVGERRESDRRRATSLFLV